MFYHVRLSGGMGVRGDPTLPFFPVGLEHEIFLILLLQHKVSIMYVEGQVAIQLLMIEKKSHLCMLNHCVLGFILSFQNKLPFFPAIRALLRGSQTAVTRVL